MKENNEAEPAPRVRHMKTFSGPDRAREAEEWRQAAFAKLAHLAQGSTANAMTSASVLFEDADERLDWHELPRKLAALELTHLRVIADSTEPVIPKLGMLIDWQPRLMSEQIVKLTAMSVLNERVAAREHSHGRTLQWIGLLGTVIGLAVGILVGRLSA